MARSFRIGNAVAVFWFSLCSQSPITAGMAARPESAGTANCDGQPEQELLRLPGQTVERSLPPKPSQEGRRRSLMESQSSEGYIRLASWDQRQRHHTRLFVDGTSGHYSRRVLLRRVERIPPAH